MIFGKRPERSSKEIWADVERTFPSMFNPDDHGKIVAVSMPRVSNEARRRLLLYWDTLKDGELKSDLAALFVEDSDFFSLMMHIKEGLAHDPATFENVNPQFRKEKKETLH